jgi:cell cycle arrest protein BUB2
LDLQDVANSQMIDSILMIVDPELFAHLSSKGQLAETYCMPRMIILLSSILTIVAVLSFSGCTPPLEELLKLWDFFFAFGVHLNIIAVVAQIILNREELLLSEKLGEVNNPNN